MGRRPVAVRPEWIPDAPMPEGALRAYPKRAFGAVYIRGAPYAFFIATGRGIRPIYSEVQYYPSPQGLSADRRVDVCVFPFSTESHPPAVSFPIYADDTLRNRWLAGRAPRCVLSLRYIQWDVRRGDGPAVCLGSLLRWVPFSGPCSSCCMSRRPIGICAMGIWAFDSTRGAYARNSRSTPVPRAVGNASQVRDITANGWGISDAARGRPIRNTTNPR